MTPGNCHSGDYENQMPKQNWGREHVQGLALSGFINSTCETRQGASLLSGASSGPLVALVHQQDNGLLLIRLSADSFLHDAPRAGARRS